MKLSDEDVTVKLQRRLAAAYLLSFSSERPRGLWMEMTGEDDGYWVGGGDGRRREGSSLAFTQPPKKEFSTAKLAVPELVCAEITSK